MIRDEIPLYMIINNIPPAKQSHMQFPNILTRYYLMESNRLYSVYILDCMLRTLSILDWNDWVFLKIFLNVYFFFRHIL